MTKTSSGLKNKTRKEKSVKYQDLKARIARGETLGEDDAKFVDDYKQKIAKQTELNVEYRAKLSEEQKKRKRIQHNAYQKEFRKKKKLENQQKPELSPTDREVTISSLISRTSPQDNGLVEVKIAVTQLESALSQATSRGDEYAKVHLPISVLTEALSTAKSLPTISQPTSSATSVVGRDESSTARGGRGGKEASKARGTRGTRVARGATRGVTVAPAARGIRLTRGRSPIVSL